MSSRGLTTGSSIKRDKIELFYLYFILLDPVVKPRDDTNSLARDDTYR
ncbi:MAG: palindromic element RPE4 domain-containing protein [Rickettsia endosymbiont of Stiretrus anchorago]|nr:palindromic element RPE4 domain-containing protein [Rickettsia endosymbiont of Stiretrus anchorago]